MVPTLSTHAWVQLPAQQVGSTAQISATQPVRPVVAGGSHPAASAAPVEHLLWVQFAVAGLVHLKSNWQSYADVQLLWIPLFTRPPGAAPSEAMLPPCQLKVPLELLVGMVNEPSSPASAAKTWQVGSQGLAT